MTILDTIIAHKRTEIDAARDKVSLNTLKSLQPRFPEVRGFAAGVRNKKQPAIIAEIKRASPSKGLIRPDLDPVTTAKAYERGGAAALSILTDEKFFQGHLDFVAQVRAAGVKTPILRKDFMIDPYQIWESRAAGADAILLIVAALNLSQLEDLYAQASELNLDVLLEIHNAEELETAITLLKGKSAQNVLLGINNRDLKTFVTDLAVTENLVTLIPPELKKQITLISESGIFTAEDIKRLAACGSQGYLIGESLVKTGDPGDNLAELITESVKLLG